MNPEARAAVEAPTDAAAARTGTILNVGCGTETYGTHFVDVYPVRPGVQRCNVAEDRLPFPDGMFDEVYSKNLFEHVSAPLHVLREMARVLRQGGTIRLITDNAGWLLFHLPFRRGNYLEHYSNDPREGPEDRHFFLFTPLHLANLARLAGLEVLEQRYEYLSKRRAVAALRPVLRVLSHTPLRHLLYPHLLLVARRPAEENGSRGPP